MEKMKFAPTGRANSPPSIRMSSRSASSPAEDGNWVVEVHQVVHDRKGNLLLDTTVYHTYQFRDGLIARMDISSDSTVAGKTDDRSRGSFRHHAYLDVPLARRDIEGLYSTAGIERSKPPVTKSGAGKKEQENASNYPDSG